VDYQKARDEISETFNFYLAALEERRGEVVRELTSAYTTKSVSAAFVHTPGIPMIGCAKAQIATSPV